ncbi:MULTISPECIES: hypothetical protein [unclassified Bradyrhizobium]|uniref:hypothetical protein n=1 Tax=unclassified Bradyrhizobium TaxID=2631580 RepID=UPI001FFB1F1D|nr:MULTISPECIES: hypothetical protein [unclassified Bradyrhizobium]
MNILAALPGGDVRLVFDGRAHSYEIKPKSIKPGASRVIRFDLLGSYCGGFGAQTCVKERAITTRPFAFREP